MCACVQAMFQISLEQQHFRARKNPMVDFKKLSDPVYRAEVKARQHAAEERQEALKKAIDSALELCENKAWALSPREQEFIRSAKRAHNSFRPLTPAQVKWLGDVEEKVLARVGFITVTQGLRGWFAVHITTDEDGCMAPEASGFGSSSSPEGAYEEAQAWAESEGLPFVAVNSNQPSSLKEVLTSQAAPVKPAPSAPPATFTTPVQSLNRSLDASAAALAQTPVVEAEPTRGRALIEAARARARGPR